MSNERHAHAVGCQCPHCFAYMLMSYPHVRALLAVQILSGDRPRTSASYFSQYWHEVMDELQRSLVKWHEATPRDREAWQNHYWKDTAMLLSHPPALGTTLEIDKWAEHACDFFAAAPGYEMPEHERPEERMTLPRYLDAEVFQRWRA